MTHGERDHREGCSLRDGTLYRHTLAGDVHVRAEARPISNRALSRLIGPPSDPMCPPDGVGATATPQPSHPVSVPDVSAMSLKEAGAALDRLGLGISVAREVVSGQPRGTILAQDPAAGAQVA